MASGDTSWYRYSDYSTIAYAEFQPKEKLGTPVVTALVSGNDVTLNWSAISNATSYKIYREGVEVKEVTGTQAMITGLNKGQYEFAVIASGDDNYYNDSDPSNISVEITKKMDLNVPDLQSRVSGNDVTLSWTSVPDANNYTLKKNGVVYMIMAGNTITLNDLPLGSYLFSVMATGDTSMFNNSPYSDEVQVQIVDETKTKLESPVLTVSVTGNDVSLSWTAVSNATGYKVKQNNIVVKTLSGNLHEINDLPVGKYTFSVIATGNSSLYVDSDPSNVEEVQIVDEVKTKLISPVLSYTLSGNDVTLQWTTIIGASQYVVKKDGVEIRETTATNLQVNDLGLGEHTFVVIATGNTNLYVDSDPSNEEKVMVEDEIKTRLKSPIVSSSLSGNDITLEWTAVDHATEYIVKHNGSEVATVSGLQTLLNDLALGKHNFVVIAKGNPALYINSYPSNLHEIEVEDEIKTRLASPELTAQVSENDVALSWSIVPGASKYQVWVNDVKHGEVEGTLTLLNNLDDGTYSIYIVATGDSTFYIDSHSSNAQEVDIISFHVDREQYGTITIYPNPVNSVLNVEGVDEIESVSIYTIDGKKLNTLDNPGKLINVEELDPGVYILQVKKEKGLEKLKFIKY